MVVHDTPGPPSVKLSLSNPRGNLTILNSGTEGFAPLVVVSGGHSATIRCAHWDHEVGGWGVSQSGRGTLASQEIE